MEHFINEIAARLTGPLHFRFIIQPIVAILLGLRDGKMDAKAGSSPYIINLFTHREQRSLLFRSAFISILKPVLFGIFIDGIAQYLIFKTISPSGALFVGSFVIAIPYVLARGLSNRFYFSKRARL